MRCGAKRGGVLHTIWLHAPPLLSLTSRTCHPSHRHMTCDCSRTSESCPLRHHSDQERLGRCEGAARGIAGAHVVHMSRALPREVLPDAPPPTLNRAEHA